MDSFEFNNVVEQEVAESGTGSDAVPGAPVDLVKEGLAVEAQRQHKAAASIVNGRDGFGVFWFQFALV